MNYEQMMPTINMQSYTPPSVLPPDKREPMMRRLIEDSDVREKAMQDMMQNMQQMQVQGLTKMNQPGSMTFLPGGTP